MRSLIVAAMTAALVFTPLAAAGAAPAESTVDLALPKPTGPAAVGRTTLALVDRSRPDPWVPDAGPRRLMVTMFYPAVPHTGTRASYMDIDEANALVDFGGFGDQLPGNRLAAARTWSRTDARPLKGRHPLVLLSPGFTVPRHTLTGLAEDLASHGYLVAAVDHAYESVAAKFPGGVLPCAACDLPDQIGIAPIAINRGKDLKFVLDQVTRTWPVSRVAAVGHSMGGDAAATTMRADHRVRAGVNLDGPMLPAESVGNRPFLLLGSTGDHATGGTFDPSWDEVWPHLAGWKRWLTVDGADHYSFTDLDLLVQQAGIEEPFELDPARGVQLTRTYVRAFLDRHLRGLPRPVLDGPVAAYPEITFQQETH
ncbi:MAG TPA: alpha/beta hydrolase [Actinophytocola sp.]|uniref:alpha/beta hydrolase family protein n=1 Tax=Actinophytocola sp. TaxID=1872138 RepID=UPI002F946BB4